MRWFEFWRAARHLGVSIHAVVQAFAAKYGWDITVSYDEDIGQLTLLEFSPHRWLFGLELPIIESDRST